MFEGIQKGLSKTLERLRGQAKIKESDVAEALESIRLSLLEADVEFKVVKRFVERVREAALGAKITQSFTAYQEFQRILYQEILSILGGETTFDLQVKPPVVVFLVGLQGTGKTTSAGKLGFLLKKKMKRKPLLVSVDVTRPAAIEQLERFAKDVKLDVFSSPSLNPHERAAQAFKYAQTYGLDTLIVDTAGRLSIDEAMMGELEELKRGLSPHHVLFVADAMSGQQGVKVAEGFAARVGLTGVILTKADSDARGGVAFSIRETLGVPLYFVGTGEKLEAFEAFQPKRYVSRLLDLGDLEGLVEKAEEIQSEISEEKAKKLTKGDLSLKDFQDQLKMISKLGPMKNLMGMLPGMGQLSQAINQEEVDQKLKRIDSMINSMTVKEREDPDLLDGSRKRRIAKGSGNRVEDLNQFLKDFSEMRKMMKRFSGKGMRGLMRGLPGGMRAPFGR